MNCQRLAHNRNSRAGAWTPGAGHAPDGRSTVDHEYFGPKNVYTALERARMNTSSRKIIFEYFGTISKKVIFWKIWIFIFSFSSTLLCSATVSRFGDNSWFCHWKSINFKAKMTDSEAMFPSQQDELWSCITLATLIRSEIDRIPILGSYLK